MNYDAYLEKIRNFGPCCQFFLWLQHLRNRAALGAYVNGTLFPAKASTP